MNEHEIVRLAAAMNQARPDWPVKSLRSFITTKLAERPYRDVFVALAWVATEPNTHTPARVLEAGPWWRAAAVEGNPNPREPFDPGAFCGICSQPKRRCEAVWRTDHDFVTAAEFRQRTPARRPTEENRDG